MPSSQMGSTMCPVFGDIRFIRIFAKDHPKIGGERVDTAGIKIWKLFTYSVKSKCMTHLLLNKGVIQQQVTFDKP